MYVFSAGGVLVPVSGTGAPPRDAATSTVTGAASAYVVTQLVLSKVVPVCAAPKGFAVQSPISNIEILYAVGVNVHAPLAVIIVPVDWQVVPRSPVTLPTCACASENIAKNPTATRLRMKFLYILESSYCAGEPCLDHDLIVPSHFFEHVFFHRPFFEHLVGKEAAAV